MRTLFDIGHDLIALATLLEERDGNVTDPDVEAAVAAWFKELEADEANKLESYRCLIAQWEMEAAASKAEAEQWQKRAKSREDRVAWLKAKALAYLEYTGRKEATCASGKTFRVCANGGKLPLEIVDGTRTGDVGMEYLKVYTDFDREKIREALEKGQQLEFARLNGRGTHLRIK